MTEPQPLLELLENAKVLQGGRIDHHRVLRLTAGQLTDLGAQAAAVTEPNVLAAEPAAFSHTATLSLGGGTEPCAGVDCRIQHIDQLVQVAAFYSDRVYIHNFLSDHENQPHSGHVATLEERRHKLLDDLLVIQRVRPLIEAKLVVPVTATGEVCNQCVAIGAFGTEADKRFARERKRLARKFFTQMSVTLEHSDGEWGIECTGPEELLEHGGRFISFQDPPEALRHMSRLLNRAVSGELVPLSRDVRRRLGSHDEAADDVFGSVIFEMAVSQSLGASYLSDTKLPIEVLSAISGDPDLAKRNSLVQRHITSMVPFAGDLTPESVLKVRKREAASFLMYRQALNRAIDDVRATRPDFTERDARAIYFDVVAPELARLDRAVKSARRDVRNDVGRSIVGWSAAITFGMYTGLLPEQLAAAAQALGLTKVLADVGSGAGKLLSPEEAIKKQDLFFLWKVRQLSQRRQSPTRAA